MKTPDLTQTQQWLSTVLMVRGDLEQKLNIAANPHGVMLHDCIKSTKKLGAMRRVDIYAAGYVMRLVECLKGEFALLNQFMGEEVFETFAKAFIVSLPSESWTLHQLGGRFADFLRQTKPIGDFSAHQQAMLSIPAELAKFERAKAQALLKPGPETALPTPAINEIELLCGIAEDFTIAVPESAQLIHTDYPLLPLIAQLEQSTPYTIPEPMQTHITVSRQQYRIKACTISDWQADFLLHLQTKPLRLRDAISSCAHDTNVAVQTLHSQLAVWLPSAMNVGLVMRVP
ncbi:DNA-binding domain-containing protein [Pseudoalteromonas peptidolytica]|uniref:DNA-binding domain-containing protein n=1 Tax=Pseudoalteromonas peptidolytica TaxID=61150 RepID=UPI00298D68AF|nr:DNA-binding domain-containing protein [Pseudoalteromonas peptidolytica]MDW7548960.1 DNA-binding domain-containing protein [Pseudoalteromonas peptidolytica]